MSYWDTKDALKELYVKAVQEPHIAWHLEYLKEKAKRIETEEKYERLTRKIKENAIEEVNAREVETIGNDHWQIEDEHYGYNPEQPAWLTGDPLNRDLILENDRLKEELEKAHNLIGYYSRLLEMEP